MVRTCSGPYKTLGLPLPIVCSTCQMLYVMWSYVGAPNFDRRRGLAVPWKHGPPFTGYSVEFCRSRLKGMGILRVPEI